MTKTPSIFDLRSFDFHLENVNYDKTRSGTFHFRDRNTCELVYKINGKSKQNFDGLTIELVPDSIYFIPAGTSNSVTVTEPGTVINIHFLILGAAGELHLLPELIHQDSGNRYKKLFLSAFEMWSMKDAASYFRTKAQVADIFAELISDREQQYMQSSTYRLIEPALEHIRVHFREPITVTALSEMCGISDEYLRTLIRSHTGQTPLAYINTLRLEYARDLLMSGYHTVAQAAEASGFESPEYFSRLFKKQYHITPRKAIETKIVTPDVFYRVEEEPKS